MEVYLEGKFVHLAPHSIVGGPFHRATELRGAVATAGGAWNAPRLTLLNYEKFHT